LSRVGIITADRAEFSNLISLRLNYAFLALNRLILSAILFLLRLQSISYQGTYRGACACADREAASCITALITDNSAKPCADCTTYAGSHRSGLPRFRASNECK